LATAAGPLLLCLSPHRWRRLSQAERDWQAAATLGVLRCAYSIAGWADALVLHILRHNNRRWLPPSDLRQKAAEAHLRAAGLRATRRDLLAAARKAVER
jgi:hypothetical protein